MRISFHGLNTDSALSAACPRNKQLQAVGHMRSAVGPPTTVLLQHN